MNSCSSTVQITSDYPVRDKVDLISISEKKTKEIKGVSLPYKYKVKDNNVPQLLLISSNSNSCIYDSIWIESGSRDINENWIPPAIMFATITLGIATPILNYIWADVPSKEYYNVHGVQRDNTNSYKLDDAYKELNLYLLIYQLLENNEPKKAYAIANYLIKKNPSAELHYLRAISKIKEGNKKKALKDFKKALALLDNDSQPWLTNEIHNNINLIKSQISYERKQKWSAIGSTILSIGQVAVNSYLQQSNTIYGGYGTNINNNLLDPRLAVSQVKNQLYQEYNVFNNYNKKPDGTNYSFDEWMAIKSQALNNANTESSDFGNSYDFNSNTSTTKTYVPDCHLCHGSGKCNTCYGEHRYINPLTNEYVTCPNCKPDGLCSACGGTGEKR